MTNLQADGGTKDANIFLRNHPWPDAYNGAFRADAAPKRRAPWNYACRPSVDEPNEYSEVESDAPSPGPDRQKFIWTEQLKQNFREELEKLVILDYIMRNTDRGLDNWMIKVNYDTGEVSVTSEPVIMNLDVPSSAPGSKSASRPGSADPVYRVQEPMSTSSRSGTPLQSASNIKIGAIDNSLAFPWKHPDQWRSFPFGWLFLPVSLIGQPFSQKSRDHFIPLLTSTKWWSETQTLLRKLFEQDSDFKERMFQKQLAVLKGQAFNVVETLKTPDQGPLELTRRPRVHVWDDEMEVPIAVPLSVPSSEDRRRRRSDLGDDGEMDIGAMASSAPPSQDHDLLGISPPVSKLPSTVRLGRSSAQQFPHIDRGRENASEPASFSPPNNGPQSSARSAKSDTPAEQRLFHSNRVSYDAGVISRGGRFTRTSGDRRSLHSPGFPTHLYHDDDTEGDLGYSAVGGCEGARRKVIAERLEAVKSRNPVFTWC